MADQRRAGLPRGSGPVAGRRALGSARRRAILAAAALAAALAIGLAVYLKVSGVRLRALVTARQAPPAAGRPAAWAAPVVRPGLPNLFKVSDDLYRGMQPTAEGFRELQALGVKTVVNLRSLHSDRGKIAGTDLEYEHVRVEPWDAETDEAVRFLRIVTDKGRVPVFVHCQHGADRTGAMCAVYRIAVQGWSKEEAIREMTDGGFGYHEAWENLIAFIRGVDVPALRRQAGLDAASDGPPP